MHAHGSGVAAQRLHRQGRAVAGLVLLDVLVGHAVRMAMGEAEVLPNLRDAVELILCGVVSHPVLAMVAEPELLDDRMPVEALRVTNTGSNYLHVGAIRAVAPQLRVALTRQQADIAGRANPLAISGSAGECRRPG